MSAAQGRKKKLSSRFRVANWRRYVGTTIDAMCFTGCGHPISINDFDCGHIIAESRGGSTTHENIVPICHVCNLSMGSKSMREYCTENGYTPLIDLSNMSASSASSSASVPPIAAQTTVPFNVTNMDITQQLGHYKETTLAQLDRALDAYIKTLRKRCLRNGDFQCDNRFSNRVFDDFLNSRFHLTNIYANVTSWGPPGQGRFLLQRILQKIKQEANQHDLPHLEDDIQHLDRIILDFIRTMRQNIPT